MRSIVWVLGFCLASSAAVQAAEIRVMSPGVIANSGLRELAAAYTKKTGTVVTVVPEGMGQIVGAFRTGTPAADLVMLPMDLMGTLALDHGIRPGSFTPLGRVEIGLFKKADAPRPDISTVEKLAVVLKGASAVMYSDPVSGSMQAAMSEQLLKRPEFAGVKGKPVAGDAEPALRRGDGDAHALGLGLIHGPHVRGQAQDNPFLIGALPFELGEHMDMATAISVRSEHAREAQDFVAYMLSAEAAPVWASKGTDRY
jgi:molybdate transport system substrate-binding protein